MQTFGIKTQKQTQMIDIIAAIKRVVAEAGVREGLCTVFIPHTTAGVTINENADPAVPRDMLMEINKIVPFHDNYKHMEGNSAAHLKSTLFGCSTNVIVADGQLCLGTWQSVFFCEFDGPRERNVWVQVTGT
jgi:secondary thiamine-phosphate synthase enzyme